MQNFHWESISNIQTPEDVIVWATDCLSLPGQSRRGFALGPGWSDLFQEGFWEAGAAFISASWH